MKIALDATPLSIESGGVRRYVEELSLALAESFPEDDFWFVSDQPFHAPTATARNLNVGRGPRNFLERRWWLCGLNAELSRLGIDLFHGTDFSVPYICLRPTVMTIHDLSPWMKPEWHATSHRVRRRTPVLLRRGLVTMVITPSEVIKEQAIERFQLDRNRVVAVPLAASSMFHRTGVVQVERPYLLYVGTLEPRKNLGFLLEIWRELRRMHGVDLVLVGRRRPDHDEIPPEPGLQIRGFVLDEELPQLYSGALACLYPSCYEGFGLPVLEAMQCGAIVVASKDPAVVELAGDAAILLNLDDKQAWLEMLSVLIKQPDRFQPLREQGIARAAQFSWSKTARLTREVYAEAVSLFRKS